MNNIFSSGSLLSLLLTIALSLPSYAQEWKRENLGSAINTSELEGAPVISPDGRTLYFVRDNGGDGYAIWYSELGADDKWGKAKKMGDGLNNENNNEVMLISADGNTLYLQGTYGANASGDRGISTVTRTRNGWSKPKELKFEKSPDNWGSFNITMSSDARVMILSLSSDLYVSFLKEKGVWSEPRLLDETLNTSTYEYTPFLAADDRTLYFSSGGHGSYGENDIFKTTRLDDTWLNWSEPENLGPSINTTEWESYFRIAAAGDYAYVLSWSDSYGEADLFRVKLQEKQRPDPVVLVKGRVLDATTREPLEATISYSASRDKGTSPSAATAPSTGEYQMILSRGKKYTLTAAAEGYSSASRDIDLTKVKEYQEMTVDLLLKPSAKRDENPLNSIYFDLSEYTLSPESREQLNRVFAFLQANPTTRLDITGYTDDIGSDDDNMTLSVNRANAAMQYLLEKGIEYDRLGSKGLGERGGITGRDSEGQRAKNRRVEFRVVK